MSHDRNAGGLEQTVQRLNRFFFCRSFHSKLSPVGGLSPLSGTAGLHPSSRLNLTSKTLPSLRTRRAERHLKACPPGPLVAAGCRGSNHIRSGPVTSTAPSEIRSSPVYAGHQIKPLKKLAFIRRRLQSWTGFEAPECRAPPRILHRATVPPPFERSRWTSEKEWSPVVSSFRNASLGVPATAGTPGARSLTSLSSLAKSKIQTSFGGNLGRDRP